jgi:hypothetical protein
MGARARGYEIPFPHETVPGWRVLGLVSGPGPAGEEEEGVVKTGGPGTRALEPNRVPILNRRSTD